jgi:hypothetical protein
MADGGCAIGRHWIGQGNEGQGNGGAGPPPVDRDAAAAQSKVPGFVQLVSHAHNHDAGSELQHRPGSGIVEPKIRN